MHSPKFIPQTKFDLSADALLLSSGLYAATGVVALPIWWISTGRHINPATPGVGVIENSGLAWLLTAIMLMVGFYVGPLLAWQLHGRHQRLRLVLAPAISPIIIGLIAALGPFFAGLYQVILSPITDWEYAGPTAAFVVLWVVYLLLMWHAVKRILSDKHESVLLKRLAVASVVAVAAFAVVIGGALVNDYDVTVIEELLFVLAIGFGGGHTTHIAAVLDEL